MNETLMGLVIQNLLFLDLSGDDIVNPDAAVREIENIATELGDLSDRDKRAFIEFTRKLADKEAAAGQPETRVTFLRELPENLGLIDEE